MITKTTAYDTGKRAASRLGINWENIKICACKLLKR